MGVGSIILILVVFGILGGLALLCGKYVLRYYNKIVSFFLTPFTKLKNTVTSATKSCAILHKPKFLGGFHIFILFIVATVYVVIQCLEQWQQTHDMLPLLETLVYHTAFGNFITLLSEGFSFEPAIIIAAGFSSLLAGICMKSARKAHWTMWILYSAVFIFASALLCSSLSGYFPVSAQWLNNLWNTFSTDLSRGAATFPQIVSLIGNLILFILTAYVGIILMLLILQEYLHCIVYGMLLLCGFGVISLIGQTIWPDFGAAGHWSNIVLSVALVAAIMLADIFSESADD